MGRGTPLRMGLHDPPGGRIQRGEKLVLRQHRLLLWCLAEGVQQGAFASVRVAHQG